ncbi:amino acid transporter [[Bacillus] enclensis]|uniref:Threonine/homoserine/homoserine lactone efflux protein n=1 Tax=[Bacillus] enclensis TaxID=1402860 RepID=A0A0V8HC38_9BACI|nr:LysE family transporter [[Bacillus] enclensis]KSU59964.1 amino acid transporter [[Bacillus] enclensis]SCC29281.1 Threonine/homoserine/homoserine lactone efflux protein [[Bacillus] enclensis]
MSVFISYIVLGLSLSAPMGPINALQLDKGIRLGFWHAWLVGVGGMAADAVFMLLIYFGLAQFVDTPIVQLFLWMFGFFVLVYTGIESVVKAGAPARDSRQSGGETKAKSFRTGFFMAISNPLSILFWLGIYGSILAETTETYQGGQVLICSMGIFLGITLWDFAMASVAAGTGKWFSGRIIRWISIISGLVLIGFGIYFGVKAAGILLS